MPSIRPRQESIAVDLLPWADPYICQLFAEAEQIERAERAPFTDLADWLDEQESQAVMAAEFRQPGWSISRRTLAHGGRHRYVNRTLASSG